LKANYKLAFWIFTVAFALVSTAAGARMLHGFDLWALRVSQSRPSESLDALGGLFSSFGGVEVSAVALLALLATLLFTGRAATAARVLVAFVMASLIELAMKLWLPQVPMPEETGRTTDFAPLVNVHYPYPYPSGHMLRSAFLLGTVFLLWKNRLARAVTLLALAGMALSRVYLGVHWASDVIGGALLGLAALVWAFGHRKGG
jgi:undecaprenyl-diphosphatase